MKINNKKPMSLLLMLQENFVNDSASINSVSINKLSNVNLQEQYTSKFTFDVFLGKEEEVKVYSHKFLPDIAICLESIMSRRNQNLEFTGIGLESPHEEEVKETDDDTATLQKNAEWEYFFKKYYIDSRMNYNGNYDNYLSSAMKLLNFFPIVNWEKEIASKQLTLPENLTPQKKTLILDLDETLVHSDLDYVLSDHDTILKIDVQKGCDEQMLIPLIVRPGMKEFLQFASENFELVVFTASFKAYADAILDYIERDRKYFIQRLYRESCLYLHPGLYIKDLSIIHNRELKNIIIVDNSIFAFANQLSNGVLISSFYNDKTDNMLQSLKGYLEGLILEADDIRKVNQEILQFENIKESLKIELQEEHLL